MILWYLVVTGKGQRTRELTTTCKSRYRRAGNGLRFKTNSITKNLMNVNRSDSNGRAIIWPLSTGSADSRLYDNSESVIRLYYSRELLTAREPVGPWSTVYFGGSGISVWVRAN